MTEADPNVAEKPDEEVNYANAENDHEKNCNKEEDDDPFNTENVRISGAGVSRAAPTAPPRRRRDPSRTRTKPELQPRDGENVTRSQTHRTVN